jgi:hypothetical protein
MLFLPETAEYKPQLPVLVTRENNVCARIYKNSE